MILHSKIMGEGPPLIILHGLFGSSDNWFSISKSLASTFQVHLLDQRNHGKSFRHQSNSYQNMSNDLFEYINYFG